MFPQYWTDFLTSNSLVCKNCCIPETDDHSGLGADLKVFTEEQSLDEEKNFWPGIGVAKDGYVPVACCLIGSGDPYFIKVSEGPNGHLYRIYHDAVGEQGYKPAEAIAIVLQDYALLLNYIES